MSDRVGRTSRSSDPRAEPWRADSDRIAATLATAFRRIHRERMAGLPILHPGLSVTVVGARRWQGHWLGVLITPWCMNLVLVPGATPIPSATQPSDELTIELPAGRFLLTRSEVHQSVLSGPGVFWVCSLFSPMHQFADQSAAEATAEAVMAQLFQSSSQTQPRAGTAVPAVGFAGTVVSRRNLLRGALKLPRKTTVRTT